MIEVYTKSYCPFCWRAKELLSSKKYEFEEIDAEEEEHFEEMVKRSGRTKVPQIFVNGKHIGGCDELYDLDEKGKLAKILKK